MRLPLLAFLLAMPALALENLKLSEPGYLQVIDRVDGSMLIGRIVSISSDSVRIQDDFGQATISVRAIERVRQVPESSMQHGKYRYPDLNTTRLFITTTAQMLEKGHGYYSNRYLFFSMIAYGITDRFTLGLGGLTLPLPVSDLPFYVTPKIGLIDQENTDLALGALVMRVPSDDEDDDFSTGILYGVGTFGGPEGITAGAGWGYLDGDLESKPAFTVGAKRRWSRRTSAVVESWFFPDAYGEPLVIYGIRFLGMRMSADVGMMAAPTTGAVFPGWPYFDFVFHFGG